LELEAFHEIVDEVVRVIVENGGSESSLRLLKYMYFRLHRDHEDVFFFSESTQRYLKEMFDRDPSNYFTMLMYSMSLEDINEKKHMLSKIISSAWENKSIASEIVTEMSVYG
jgi:hypothetical protein